MLFILLLHGQATDGVGAIAIISAATVMILALKEFK